MQLRVKLNDHKAYVVDTGSFFRHFCQSSDQRYRKRMSYWWIVHYHKQMA